MFVDSEIKKRSQVAVTHVSPDANSNTSTPSRCSQHKLQTSNTSVWRGIQRTFYLFTSAAPDKIHHACNLDPKLQVTSQSKGDNNLQKEAHENKYTERTRDTKRTSASNTEAESCELERTIQLMALPKSKSKKLCLNLVKSSRCSLLDISWTFLTSTLCIMSMFVINSPVAAEKPFHHRDMRDELILNPSQSHFPVDSLRAATKYLIQYGYLACNEAVHSTNVGNRRSSRPRRQAGVGSFPEVSEGGDPVLPSPQCTHTSQQVSQSLRSFQRAYRLPVTGNLDPQTLEKMNLKRCGNADLIGANSVSGSDNSAESTLHRTVKRSITTLQRAKRKATLLIEEKRRQRALKALEVEADGEVESNSYSSSLLSKILFPKSKPQMLSQSAFRRKQMIEEYEKMLTSESTVPDTQGNARRGAFVSSLHQEPVITDTAAGVHYRNKRSEVNSTLGRQRFNLNRRDCIRWRLMDDGYSQRLPVASQKSIFTMAFRMWAEVTPLCFVEVNTGHVSNIDIPIGFGKATHFGCPFPFDRMGGALAHSLPSGAIHLDDEEPWKADNGQDGINLLKIAVHEIGHVLGLEHIERNYSVMFAIYTGPIPPFQDFELGWEDRKEVQNIYGVCAGRFDVIFDWLKVKEDGESLVFNTYFFRDNKYWMYENRKNRTRYGDPQYIGRGWHGIPTAIDAYVQIWTTDEFVPGRYKSFIQTLFFKGEYCYVYDDKNDVVFENGTRLIKDRFPAIQNLTEVYPTETYPFAVSEDIPSNIDAVVWSFIDERLIFFKDQWVYVYDPQVGGCCEEKMQFRDKFPGAEHDGYVDTAYFSHFHQSLFMLFGNEVYEGYGFGNLQPVPTPRHNHTSVLHLDKWFNIWYDICDVSVTTEHAIIHTTTTEHLESNQQASG